MIKISGQVIGKHINLHSLMVLIISISTTGSKRLWLGNQWPRKDKDQLGEHGTGGTKPHQVRQLGDTCSAAWKVSRVCLTKIISLIVLLVHFLQP